MSKPTTDTTTLSTRERRPTKSGTRAQLLIGLVLIALVLPLHAAAGDQLPLKATETGMFQLNGSCGTGGLVLEVTGTGYATQLGNYRSHSRECFDPATGVVTGGSFTLTAANGDAIFGTYSGQVSPGRDPYVIAYDDPGLITGGTGRFAHASGIVTQSGLANLETGEYEGTLTGSVSSPILEFTIVAGS
jgi:hypothetical protein